jgi:hypothetical protein
MLSEIIASSGRSTIGVSMLSYRRRLPQARLWGGSADGDHVPGAEHLAVLTAERAVLAISHVLTSLEDSMRS